MERAETDEVVAGLVPEVVVADLLLSLSDGLQLYRCLSPGALIFLRSFLGDVESAGTHSMSLVHC